MGKSGTPILYQMAILAYLSVLMGCLSVKVKLWQSFFHFLPRLLIKHGCNQVHPIHPYKYFIAIK